jgi:hypothetical protein
MAKDLYEVAYTYEKNRGIDMGRPPLTDRSQAATPQPRV